MSESINLLRESKAPKKRRETRLPLLCRLVIERDLPANNRETPDSLLAEIKKNTGISSDDFFTSFSPSPGLMNKWRQDFLQAQEDQLGKEWLSDILVNRSHSPRRLEIIRRCRKEMDPPNFAASVRSVYKFLESKQREGESYRLPGWFFVDDPQFIEIHSGQIATGEKSWVEFSLFGEPKNG